MFCRGWREKIRGGNVSWWSKGFDGIMCYGSFVWRRKPYDFFKKKRLVFSYYFMWMHYEANSINLSLRFKEWISQKDISKNNRFLRTVIKKLNFGLNTELKNCHLDLTALTHTNPHMHTHWKRSKVKPGENEKNQHNITCKGVCELPEGAAKITPFPTFHFMPTPRAVALAVACFWQLLLISCW